MNKRHIITMAGGLGSGKSVTAKIVAEKLGYPHYSGGDFMRKMAEKRGVSLADLGNMAETDASIDKEIDAMQKEFMDTNDSFVIDSRLGWFFAPDSFKVFLEVDPDVAAKRVLADLQKKAENRKNEASEVLTTAEEVKNNQAKRVESERQRYEEYYGIKDHYDKNHFDFCIDTNNTPAEVVAEKILEAYKNWLG